MSPLCFRSVTAGVVAAFLGASHLAFREADARVAAQYLFVITLGYGHLIGAALGARHPPGRPFLVRAFTAVTIATGFALYAEAVAAWPWLVFVWLALSVWHITENDVALARALPSGALLGPLERAASRNMLPLAAAVAVAAAVFAVSDDPGLFADIFSAATLFHLVGWLVSLIARGASPLRLFALHAPPCLLCALLLFGPADAAAWLRDWLFSPALYLYWSCLHVVHTVFLRGIVSPGPAQRGVVVLRLP